LADNAPKGGAADNPPEGGGAAENPPEGGFAYNPPEGGVRRITESYVPFHPTGHVQVYLLREEC
jgi:hypothetical protein